jgi:hypothetical protein
LDEVDARRGRPPSPRRGPQARGLGRQTPATNAAVSRLGPGRTVIQGARARQSKTTLASSRKVAVPTSRDRAMLAGSKQTHFPRWPVIQSQGRSQRSVLILYAAALVSSLLTMQALFGGEAHAIMSSTPTCYPSRATCTRCIESEGPRPGRCVKCAHIPGCVSPRAIKASPSATVCYALCIRDHDRSLASKALCRAKCR